MTLRNNKSARKKLFTKVVQDQPSKQNKQGCYSSKCMASGLSGILPISSGAEFYFKKDSISFALLIFASGIVLFGKILECATNPKSIKRNEPNSALNNETEKSDNNAEINSSP